MKNNRNNRLVFLILTVIIVIAMLVLANYENIQNALYHSDDSTNIIITNNSDQTVNVGNKHEEKINNNMVFEYYFDKDKHISLDNAFPISDEEGKTITGDKINNFKLRFSKDAKDIKYTITVEKMGNSTLDDKFIKVLLISNDEIDSCYRNDNTVKTFNEYINYNHKNNEKVIYEGVVSDNDIKKGSKDFVFRMWLSDELQLENSDYLSEEKTYNIRVNVYAIKNK